MRRSDVEGWGDPLAELRWTDLETLISPELPRLLETHGLRLGRLANLGETAPGTAFATEANPIVSLSAKTAPDAVPRALAG